MRTLVRRVRALPVRARLALVAAVLLSFVAVLLLAWPSGDDGGDAGDGTAAADDDTAATDDLPQTSSTTISTGGIEVDAPDVPWMYHIPVDGRHTARSALRSPSKSPETALSPNTPNAVAA